MEQPSVSEASVSDAVTELASESFELQPKKSFPTKAVVLALCSALAVVAVAAVQVVPSGQVNVIDDALIDLAEAKKNKTKKIKLLPKPEECSLAQTQNCMTSQCCDNFGFQCYQKNTTFAACLKKCDAQKMATAGNGTWSCAELGVKNRGALTTENCLPYGRCAD